MTAGSATLGPRSGVRRGRSSVLARNHRWVVERTFAWLGKYRRLAKDYEYLAATSENVVYLAMITPRTFQPAGQSLR
ncbi:transposase [[Actinomadura] parvosata]|uniref:transposase n=1 Tax=[Actinomadura] parvosata TaxID=1955412 RepID=UPI0012BCC1A9